MENEAIELSSNLRDRKRQLEEEDSNFIEMEEKLVEKQRNVFDVET